MIVGLSLATNHEAQMAMTMVMNHRSSFFRERQRLREIGSCADRRHSGMPSSPRPAKLTRAAAAGSSSPRARLRAVGAEKKDLLHQVVTLARPKAAPAIGPRVSAPGSPANSPRRYELNRRALFEVRV